MRLLLLSILTFILTEGSLTAAETSGCSVCDAIKRRHKGSGCGLCDAIKWRERQNTGAVCCEAVIASCKACKVGVSVEEYCLKDENKYVNGCCKIRDDCANVCTADVQRCPDGTEWGRDENCAFPTCPEELCPAGCQTWFDGCNTCKCDSDGKKTCTRKYCFQLQDSKCMDSEQSGQNYNCNTKEIWSAEKRQWCCLNNRLGCCPEVKCAAPKPGCTRTRVDDINDFGCALYPCGKDECPDRTTKNPQISIKDTRGLERFTTQDSDTTKVTLQIMDTKGIPRVSIGGAQQISMENTDNIVRRRNIVRAIVDAAEGSAMNFEDAGLSDEADAHMEVRLITDVVFSKVRAKTKTNPTDCTEADINLVRDDTNKMAFEIVLDKVNDQSFKCYNGKPLSLLTLKTNQPDSKNEYEARCWTEGNNWETKGMYEEGEHFTCQGLPKYKNFVASDLGAMAVTQEEELSAGVCQSATDCGTHTDAYCQYECTDNKCVQRCEASVACEGSFGTCRSDCKQAYSIIRQAANGGDACAHTAGDTQDCTGGQCVPEPDVTFGPGVPKIEACWEDSVTVLWEGTHNLVETESAECDSNVIKTWTNHETTGYRQQFTNLGGQYRGQTRYFKCSTHCGKNKARFEVYCPLIVDPGKPVTVNTAGSNLEWPGLIVAVSVAALLVIFMAFILCPRPKRVQRTQYQALSQDDGLQKPGQQAEVLNLRWLP